MRDQALLDFVLDQLSAAGDVESRAMFGGHGLYLRGAIFGIVHRGKLWFRTNAETRLRYVAMGAQPFRPSARQTLKAYYEVPIGVLENRAELVSFALEAAAAHGAN